jgi:predicted transcriptional regulator
MLHVQSLETVAQRRRALGLTQSELARLSGVSQSYIAKLEAKNIEPSYAKVQAIFEALSELEQGRETKAGEIMTENLLSVSPGDPIQKAVNLIWEHSISQLPVLAEGVSIGSITERHLIDNILVGRQNNNLRDRLVSEVMGDPFPLLGEDTPVSLIADMLKIYPAVLVQRKGKVVGIITKADLLKKLM